jgi:low affinity Fe/Cu permease
MKWNIDTIADTVTTHIGSGVSLVLHTIVFGVCIVLIISGFHSETIMLALTTLVSLEAIYLSLFIQITVNKNSKVISEISQDVDEIQVDIDEIQHDVDEIQEDVEDIGEELDIEEVADTVAEIQESMRLDRIESVLVELVKEIKEIKKDK